MVWITKSFDDKYVDFKKFRIMFKAVIIVCIILLIAVLGVALSTIQNDLKTKIIYPLLGIGVFLCAISFYNKTNIDNQIKEELREAIRIRLLRPEQQAIVLDVEKPTVVEPIYKDDYKDN